MTKNIKVLERIYFGLLIIVLMLIVFNNYFVTRRFDRATLQGMVLSVGLFAVAYIVYTLYRREVANNLNELENLKQDKQGLEEKVDEAFRYIGQLNVQIEEIRSVFGGIKKYPESKSELKFILDFLAGKVLAMADANWACFKIVDPLSSKLLAEHCKCRGDGAVAGNSAKPEIAVRAILDKDLPDEYTLIWSDQEGLNLRVFCLLPKQELTREQKVFIKAIVNQLEMFYLIYSSLSHQKESLRDWR